MASLVLLATPHSIACFVSSSDASIVFPYRKDFLRYRSTHRSGPKRITCVTGATASGGVIYIYLLVASRDVSMLRAAGRPGSCRRSNFPRGRAALARRARARRAWWAHLRRGATDSCGHIARSLLFGRQKPWSLSQNLRSSISFPLPTHLAFG